MNFLEKLPQVKVLVVGDVMLDRYWWGSVARISPEAPVPVVRLTRASVAAGGAANVAVNLAGLGVTPILVGAVGADAEAGSLRQVLTEAGVAPDHLVELKERPTTVKTRIIAHSQQVARVDHEVNVHLESDEIETVLESLSKLVDAVDAVVISDYAKGLVCADVLRFVIDSAQGSNGRTFVDPKGKDYSKYSGASIITPNRREAAEACKIDEDDANAVSLAGRRLIEEHRFGSVLITRGEEGMTLFQRDAEPVHFAASARSVYDVTGAGDTVIATLAAAVAAGADLQTAASVANAAAGIVVEQVGTTAIRLSDLKIALNGS